MKIWMLKKKELKKEKPLKLLKILKRRMIKEKTLRFPIRAKTKRNPRKIFQSRKWRMKLKRFRKSNKNKLKIKIRNKSKLKLKEKFVKKNNKREKKRKLKLVIFLKMMKMNKNHQKMLTQKKNRFRKKITKKIKSEKIPQTIKKMLNKIRKWK